MAQPTLPMAYEELPSPGPVELALAIGQLSAQLAALAVVGVAISWCVNKLWELLCTVARKR